ncbi:uncharacterized protein YbjT (DUF2867 family) [Arthrobacter sp. 2762]
MKIVVFGGTGLIGKQVVEILSSQGHEAKAASPSTGVDSVTGQGLDEAMVGADVVVDLTNTSDFDEKVVVPFFSTSSRNLLAAGKRAGVQHHVALSVVGTDRIDVGYFAGKTAQEKAVREGGVPYTILRATQFFEFLPVIANAGMRDGSIHVTNYLMQPMAAADVARIVAETAVSPAIDGVLEMAGPERAGINEFVGRVLAAHNDSRPVVVDTQAGYFSIPIEETSIVPLGESRIGDITLKEWLNVTS